MSYALYHLTVNGSTVELSHRDELPWSHIATCDSWLADHRRREEYRRRRGELAELKETHGCGYRPRIEVVTT